MSETAEIDADLLARMVEHILTDRAHMHCPLRPEVEAATCVIPPGQNPSGADEREQP